jgi:hypothetical protein
MGGASLYIRYLTGSAPTLHRIWTAYGVKSSACGVSKLASCLQIAAFAAREPNFGTCGVRKLGGACKTPHSDVWALRALGRARD